MNKKRLGEHFAIHSFMPMLMGLSGSELLVYALIYSFCSCGEKFYGSISYISERTGASESTVKRTLKSLTKMKYISKVGTTECGTVEYSIDMSFIKKYIFGESAEDEGTLSISPKPDSEVLGQIDTYGSPCQNEPLPVSKRTSSDAKMSCNNKEIINNTTTTPTTRAAEKNFRRDIRRYGYNDLVMMSYDQLEELYRRFGEDVVDEYVIKLDSYLASFPYSYFKNHYKTIISWIEDDFRA